MKRVVIFDCDGVLIDSEQQAHLAAFNQMWSEQKIPWHWSVEEYARKLNISGGKERLESLYYDVDFRAITPIPTVFDEWKALVKVWHQRKTQIYAEMVASGAVQPRSGVRRLAEEALGKNWAIMVSSSGARASIEAVLQHVMGASLAKYFHILADDVVTKKKPAPDIYTLASHITGVAPYNCVAIEDNRNGLLAASRAHINCIITPTSFTLHENFAEAALVVSCLGDPEGETCDVLQNRCHLRIEKYISLENLASLCSQRSHQDLIAQ